MQQLLEKQLARLEKIPFAAINVGDVVGKGRFKRVHRGRYRNRDVVVLRYAKDLSRGFSPSRLRPNAEKNAEEERDKNYNELRILSLLAKKGSESCVPEIYGVCSEPHSTIIVQEIAAWSTLKSLITNANLKALASNLHRLHCSSQISQAMAFLESERVVHADLSCRNVLIFRFDEAPHQIVAKVSDFGLSVVLKEGSDSLQLRQPQATRWCSPETVGSNKLSHRADMWSLGTTMWEMYADGEAPWPLRPKRADVAARLRDIFESNCAAEGGARVDDDFPRAAICPVVVHSVILSCLNGDEHMRPRFLELAETMARIIDMGGERDIQAEVDVAAIVSASEPVRATPNEVRPFVLPPRPSNAEPDTPQWHAFCAVAASDGLAASRLQALRVFDEADRELLLQAENRLQKQQDQIAELKKEASSRQMRAATPMHPTCAEVFGGGGSPMPPQMSSTPITPRIGVPIVPALSRETVHAPPSPSSPFRMMSASRPSTCWQPPDVSPSRWTLWSARRPRDVQQQDFHNDTEAWDAFQWTRQLGMPCSLRDPSGMEVACESWNAAVMTSSGGGSVSIPPCKVPHDRPALVIPVQDPSVRNLMCMTPPRRTRSPPVPLVSPGRMAGGIGVMSTRSVTPPRRLDFMPEVQFPRACSAIAVRPRSPPKMVPSQPLPCW